MLKKVLILLSVITLFISITIPVFAQKTEKIAVFPVTITGEGSSVNIYPSTVNLISSDISNSLGTISNLKVIDSVSVENIIKSYGLTNEYQNFLYEYKSSYAINYDICSKIAGKLGATKILFVSGGYDMQTYLLTRGKFYNTNIPYPNKQPLIPTYRLNIMLTLVDPQSGLVVWENTYGKNFEMGNFLTPSQSFGENVVPIENIKDFSRILTGNATKEIIGLLNKSESTEVSSNVISTEIPAINKKSSADELPPKENFYTTNNYYVQNQRQSKFKSWIKNNLPRIRLGFGRIFKSSKLGNCFSPLINGLFRIFRDRYGLPDSYN